MFIDHDTAANEYRAECDNCHRQWLFEGYEIELQPYPHCTCPVCGQWIALF